MTTVVVLGHLLFAVGAARVLTAAGLLLATPALGGVGPGAMYVALAVAFLAVFAGTVALARRVPILRAPCVREIRGITGTVIVGCLLGIAAGAGVLARLYVPSVTAGVAGGAVLGAVYSIEVALRARGYTPADVATEFTDDPAPGE